MAKPEPTVETVEMTDGRLVDFSGKKRLLKESFVKDGAVSVRLDFRNGETRTFTLPEDLKLKAAAHGTEQKLGDEISGVDDLDDAVLAIDNLVDRLSAGEWNVKREGGSGMAGASILLKALVEVTGQDVAKVKEFLSGRTQAEKNALRNDEAIRPVVQRLEAEKNKKQAEGAKVDTGSLLGALAQGQIPPATQASPLPTA